MQSRHLKTPPKKPLGSVQRLHRIRRQLKRAPPAVGSITALSKGLERLHAASSRGLRRQEAEVRRKNRLRDGGVTRLDLDLLSAIRRKGHHLMAPRIHQLSELATKDPKFKALYTLPAFREKALAAFGGSSRSGSGSSRCLIMVDVDHFKAFNDLLGHDAGDQVLSEFSQVLAQHAEQNHGFAGRHGGEEFLVFAPVSQARAISMMAAVRRDLSSWFSTVLAHRVRTIDPRKSKKLRSLMRFISNHQMPFSAGMAIRKPHESYDAIEKRSDQLLYMAKQTRNAMMIGGQKASRRLLF